VRVGSLIVDFAILEGSNKTAESLVATILAAGNSTTWLTAVKAVYATVSSEPLTVEGFFSAVTVTTTLAGTTNAPSMPPTAPPADCAASPVPMLAAFAVAAFALLL
jgi:hypothetical protein